MSDDLISRGKLKKHYAWWRETENGRKMADLFDEIVDAQPPAEVVERKKVEMEAVSLYGYSVRHLAFIAAVMAEKNITPQDVFEMFSNISATRDYIYEEQRRILREEVEHFLGGPTP